MFGEDQYVHRAFWSFAVITVDEVAPVSEWFPYVPDQQTALHQPNRATVHATLTLGSAVNFAATHYDWMRLGSGNPLDFDGSYARALPVVGGHYLVGVNFMDRRPERVMVNFAFRLDAQFRTEVPIYGHPAGTPVQQVLAYVAQVRSTDAGTQPPPGSDAATDAH